MDETIHDRIGTLVRVFGAGKNTVFAQKIGISEGNVRGYIKKNMPKQDVLEKIVTNLDVNPDWLLTGRGEMLMSVGMMTPEEMDQIDEEERDGKWKTHEVKSVDDSLSQLLDVIREQAEEIGRLKEKISHLEKEKEKDALDAQSSTGAIAG